MIAVRRLLWDSWNISHIARHQVTPDEVETVCHTEPIVLRGQQKNRLVVIGVSEEKRLLTIVLESKGKGMYYPITAYLADRRDISLYKRLRKGGRTDEEIK